MKHEVTTKMTVRALALVVGAALWAGCEAPVTNPGPEADAEVAAHATNTECVSINDADKDDLLGLRHVEGNEDRADEIINNRPFRNVGHLLQLSFWWDPRQPAEMVDGDPEVCEYDVAPVKKVDDLRPPYPRVDGVAYTQGRVAAADIEGEGTADHWDIGERAVFAGFQRGGTTVADFRVFSTGEQNRNLAWAGWQDRPHRTILMPLR